MTMIIIILLFIGGVYQLYSYMTNIKLKCLPDYLLDGENCVKGCD
jgi:hypothetical protein